MESTEFKELRAKLGKTQAQMAQLLGVSLKAVHSYEQGWRSVPAAVERQMYFLTVKSFHLFKLNFMQNLFILYKLSWRVNSFRLRVISRKW